MSRLQGTAGWRAWPIVVIGLAVAVAAGERGAAARWLAAIPQSGGGYHLMAQQQLEAMGRR